MALIGMPDRLVLMLMPLLALMLMLGQGCPRVRQAPRVRVGASKAGPHGAGDG